MSVMRIGGMLIVAIISVKIPVHADTITYQTFSVDAAELAQSVDSIFLDRNKPDVPGCAVGVRHAGSIDFVRGYGSADLEHDVPIEASTVFEAGSISKQFTAASILLLAEQDKLDLTDDVRKFIPELPDYGTRITLNELLSHTAGLRDWGDVETMAGWPRTSRVYSLADVLAVVARQKHLNFPPGTAYSYSNTGYNLLAIVVERVSGQSLAQFSQRYLFGPLGMGHTQWRDDFHRVVKGRAIAYEMVSGNYEQEMPFTNDTGAGGLLTTVGDLLVWNDALSTGKLGAFVTTELHRQGRLDTDRMLGYARGLAIDTYLSSRELSHSGATAGYVAWLGRYPDQDLSIALLCNAGDVNPIARVHRIADLFLGTPTPPTGEPLLASQVTEKAGLFLDQWKGLPLRLEAQGNTLRVVGGPKLTARSPNEFYAGSTTFRFTGNDRVSRESAEGEVLEYRRGKPWKPTPSELAGFVGEFRSDEAMAMSHVLVAADRLVVIPAERPAEPLTTRPLVADTFEFADTNVPGALQPKGVIRFTRNKAGQVNGFLVSTSSVRDLAFTRVRTRNSASQD